MKHLDIRGDGHRLCGSRPEANSGLTQDVESVDCETCLWRALQDVQNGMTMILRQLHAVTKANRVTVINPVAKKGFSDG
jgi:hypothetical protein